MSIKTEYLILIALLILGGGSVAYFKITKSGINKIKAYEALRLKPYRDIGGKWTIGWGHLIKPTEGYLKNQEGITEEEAEQLLANDLINTETIINSLVTVPINGNMYDSLVSLVFNIGTSAFSRSTLLKKLNKSNYIGASDEFRRWKYVGGNVSYGLVARRKREQELFLA